MPELDLSSNNATSRRVAIGGTWITAVVFLVVGVGSLLVDHGIFSAGIAVVLILYAAALGGLAWLAQKGLGLAIGLIAAAAVLHVMVAVSTARGSGEWWLWIFAVVAAATALAAGKVHLDELKQAGA
ncbi:hypothetical protein [Luteococcus sp. OSA5]|uniref:hypothetical protein n=1 Tax=Luteococcus sp. OSA5 TaxID=3401630 RepID=UPI003B43B8C1